ncbi:Uncharacterised protein [Mycobacteroides abscessus subsp. abscessus]|nr:Uncharacterised protein [Mycobacteroides abscessus subsp. abscessus]
MAARAVGKAPRSFSFWTMSTETRPTIAATICGSSARTATRNCRPTRAAIVAMDAVPAGGAMPTVSRTSR